MKKAYIVGLLIGGGVIATLVASVLVSNEAPPVASAKPDQSVKPQQIETEPPVDVSQTSNQASSDSGETPAEPSADIAVSKLAEYPGFGHQHEKDEETFSKEEQQREDLIADCMKDSGFEYTPAPSIVVDDSSLENEAEFERLLAQAAINPNQAYVEKLSPSMRESYYIALTGLPDPNIEEGLEQSQTETSNSCVSKAFASIPGVFAKRNELKEELDALESDIQNDERLTTKIQEWSSCMSASGHSFGSPSEVQGHIDQVVVSEIEQRNGINQEQNLAKVEQLNRAMTQCMNSTNLRAITQQVRTEHENRFVDTHQDRLRQ